MAMLITGEESWLQSKRAPRALLYIYHENRTGEATEATASITTYMP